MNSTALPTFRALLNSAVALHLAALPTDGVALCLRDLAPATPMLDYALVAWVQHAQIGLDGAVAALTNLAGIPEVTERMNRCVIARRAYHAAFMAYMGLGVS